MKKSNVILQAAVTSALLAMSVGAQAGNLATTTRTFATEAFGTAQSATVAVTPAAISYSISSPGGVTLAATQSAVLYLRLSGTHIWTAAPAAATFSGTVVTTLGVPATAPFIGTGTSDKGTMAVTFINTTGASVNLPVNSSIIWTPATTVTATSSTLATAGGVISVIGSLDGGVISTAATTLPSNQDPIATAVNIAVSAQAITGAAASSATFTVAEAKKINLAAASGTATQFDTSNSNTLNTTVVNLGSYTFTNNPSVVPTNLAATSNYSLAAVYAAAGGIFAGTSVTIAPGTGQAFPVGAAFNTFSDLVCTGTTGTASTPLTATTASTAVTVNTTAGNAIPGTGLKNYVCMTVTTTAAIAPVNPTIAVTLSKSVASDAANTIVATAVYPLTYNGSQKDVRNYVPASVTGWSTVVRVINTGSIAAAVNGSFIDDVTGVAGTSFPIATSTQFIKDAAITVNSATLEAALKTAGGTVPSSTARPRLRITASTNLMEVQSYVFNPNGNFSIIHGVE